MMLIDADAHVIECEETWSHLEPAFHARRPLPVTVPEDTNFMGWNAFWLIDRKVRHFGATPATGTIAKAKSFSLDCQHITDVNARIAAMDRLDIDVQVVHPSFCLSTMTEDPELEAALMRSYNTFMVDKCGQSNGRIVFNAVVPFRSPAAAIEEIRRLKPTGAMVSVLARGIEWDKPLDHPDFFPIYEEVERQGLPMVIHLGPGCPTISTMFDGQPWPAGDEKTFFPPRARRLVSTLIVQYGFYSLVESSLIDDFPALKWVFLEGGGSEWAVAAVSAIERAGKSDCRRYFDDGRIFIGCEPDENIEFVTGKLGQDCLLVSSDLPHFDEAAHDNIAEEFVECMDLAPALLDKLFHHNPVRAFDIEPPAERAAASAAANADAG
jgi:predicted TIM-barrel fold metal-dependent hydrolase